MRVVVLGSINLDVVTPVARCPKPGETVLGRDVAYLPGGKGANQALAARRAGASVAMHGAVGRDAAADIALAGLAAAGVDLAGVARADRPTGVATIAVGDDGENLIVVAPGANASVGPDIAARLPLWPGDVLVLQMELPEPTVAAALARARGLGGVRSILNIAPAAPLSDALLRQADMLVVNESEAATLVPSGSPAGMAAAIHARLGVTALVTAGADGAYAAGDATTIHAPAPRVAVVDTTGAGDSFVGMLAASLLSLPLDVALRRAVAAASLACTALGAQSAIPDGAAVDRLLSKGPP